MAKTLTELMYEDYIERREAYIKTAEKEHGRPILIRGDWEVQKAFREQIINSKIEKEKQLWKSNLKPQKGQ